MVERKSRTHAGSFKASKIETHKEEVKMCRAAGELKFLPSAKKIKTAGYAIFELLHSVEASAEEVGSISSFIDSKLLAQQPEEPKDCTDASWKELRPLCLKCQRDCKQAAKVGVVFYPQYLKLKGCN